MATVRLLVAPVFVVIAFGLDGCDSGGCSIQEGTEHGEAHEVMRTEANLWALVKVTGSVVWGSGQYAPANEKEYSIWLMERNDDVKRWAEWGTIPFDPEKKMFLDAWRRPVVLVTESGSLTGLGSSGPNGQWQNGEGDDILVVLKDLEVPVGPPGQRLQREEGTP